jgi:hypothetical protein
MAEIAWLVYNFVRPHSSLRMKLPEPVGKRLYDQRTPAMVAGVTQCLWSIVELVSFPVWAIALRNHST